MQSFKILFLFPFKRFGSRVGLISKCHYQFARGNSGPLKSRQENKPANLMKIDENWKESLEDDTATPSSDNNQRHINSCEDLISLLHIYRQLREEFTLVNYLTLLNKAVKVKKTELNESHKKMLAVKSIAEVPEIKEIINYLKTQIPKFDTFSLSNFISNLAKISYYDSEIILKTSEYITSRKDNVNFSSIAVSYILWSFAKQNYRNEKVIEILVNMLMIDSGITVKSASNIMWSLSEMKYKNERLQKKLETVLIQKSSQLDPTCCNLVFAAYKNSRQSNSQLLDLFSMVYIRKVKQISIRNIANLLNYCAEIKYTNNNLLNALEQEIISRCVNEEEPLDLSPVDSSQILISFCKMKVIKIKLFELLEANFILNIERATPKSLAHFSFAHSSLCSELLFKLDQNKNDYLARSRNNIKKYNSSFYEVITPMIKEKIKEFKYEEIYSILLSASRPQVKKRAVCRELTDISLSYLPVFINQQGLFTKEQYDKNMFLFYKVTQNFAVKQEMAKMIEQKFVENAIDLKNLSGTYGYLAIDKKQQKINEFDSSEESAGESEEKDEKKETT